MNYKELYLLPLTVVLVSGCQSEYRTTSKVAPVEETTSVSQIADQLVEASCGECQFGMPGDGCDLAVRIDGQSYFVDGSSIDDFGDAHGDDGMCNCIRQARVSGEIKDGRFVSTSFELLPFDKEKNQSEQLENLKKSRLGASFAMKGKGDLFVHEIWEEGAAYQAGLRKGDRILMLNGTPISEIEPDSLRSQLAEDSSVVFAINREDEELEITVDSPSK